MRPVLRERKPNLMSGCLIVIHRHHLAIRRCLLRHLPMCRPSRLDLFRLLVRWPFFQLDQG